MENVFLIVARIFLVAMATFGLWSAHKLSQICICRKSGVCLAIRVRDKKDVDSLENTIFEADHSSFFGYQHKYALILDERSLQYFRESELPESIRQRFDLCLRTESVSEYLGREDSL